MEGLAVAVVGRTVMNRKMYPPINFVLASAVCDEKIVDPAFVGTITKSGPSR